MGHRLDGWEAFQMQGWWYRRPPLPICPQRPFCGKFFKDLSGVSWWIVCYAMARWGFSAPADKKKILEARRWNDNVPLAAVVVGFFCENLPSCNGVDEAIKNGDKSEMSYSKKYVSNVLACEMMEINLTLYGIYGRARRRMSSKSSQIYWGIMFVSSHNRTSHCNRA